MNRKPCLQALVRGSILAAALAGCGADGEEPDPQQPALRWSAPVLLENDNATDVLHPRHAADRDGNGIVVWSQGCGIWASRFGAGSGWSEPSAIGTISGEPNCLSAPAAPEIAVDGAGNALVAWSAYDGQFEHVWTARYRPGSGWDAPVRVHRAREPRQGIGYLHLAGNANGDALAVWTEGPELLAKRYRAGAGWEAAVTLASSVRDRPAYPRAILDDSGSAMAVWEQQNQIWASRAGAGAGWVPPVPIATGASDAIDPRLALGAVGEVLAVWAQAPANIGASRYVPASGWSPPDLLAADASEVAAPAIATDPGGRLVVAWMQADGRAGFRIWARRYAPDTGWEAPQRLEEPGPGDSQFPEIALDAGGKAIAVWHVFQGERPNVWASQSDPGGGWTEPVLIGNSNPGLGAGDPRITVDARGKATVLFRQLSDGAYSLWAVRAE